MRDEDIGKLLRSLPRQQTSTGFTEKLMEKLPDRPSPPAIWRRPAFAMAGLLVAISFGLGYWREMQERAESAKRIEALRNEYRAVEKELEELRAMAAESQPVLHLSGNDELDFVVDLRELAREAEQSEARPVNYRH
jgi:hypothetical protein